MWNVQCALLNEDRFLADLKRYNNETTALTMKQKLFGYNIQQRAVCSFQLIT